MSETIGNNLIVVCTRCNIPVPGLRYLSSNGLCQRCKGTLSKFYGYGIVDKRNQPYWDDACVCQHSDPMKEVVLNLNDENYVGDTRRPYRVVKLVFEEV